MEVTLKIPENISDITLEQFQAYESIRESEVEELFIEKTINIFTGLDMSLMNDVSKKEKDSVFTQCIKAMNVQCEFINKFSLSGVEFGFVPNLDTISGNEYTDAIRYANGTDNLHRLLAVLFRPIKNDGKFGNYTIKKYKGTSEYSDLMKQTPMHIVNGCLGFFLTLRQDLEIHFQKYMKEELVKGVKL